MTSEIPVGFVLHTEWPEYPKEKDFSSDARWVGSMPRGLRRKFGPILIEEYVSDIEPLFELISSHADDRRLIIWQRLSREDVPHGWWASVVLSSILGVTRPYAETFSRITKDGSHFDLWDSKARLNKWRYQLLGRVYTIESVSSQIFWNELQWSVTWERLPKSEREHVHRILFSDDSLTRAALSCSLVKNIRTNETAAGMASIFSDTYGAAYDLLGFLFESGRSDPVMTGLMYDLFLRASDRGYSNVQFGTSVTKESPSSLNDRRGYSIFKAKFGTEYIHFQPVLFKYTSQSPKG